MSRMVREDSYSGLRERVWLARVMLDDLKDAIASGAPRGRLLALRGAVLFHAYTVPVGLLRQCARAYRVDDVENLINLRALVDGFRKAGVTAPEVALIEQAAGDPADATAWLEGEMQAAFNASALARRPVPPAEQELAFVAEDPNEPLAAGDIARLEKAVQRVNGLLEACAPHMEEW